MIKILFSIFLVLHGLVHLLYLGQSARYFELQPGMVWPDGSWALSGFLGEGGARNLASALLVLTAIGFVLGGIGLFAQSSWWRPITLFTAGFSSIIYLILWNGTLQRLDNQGAVGILINLAILAALLLFRFPVFQLIK